MRTAPSPSPIKKAPFPEAKPEVAEPAQPLKLEEAMDTVKSTVPNDWLLFITVSRITSQ